MCRYLFLAFILSLLLHGCKLSDSGSGKKDFVPEQDHRLNSSKVREVIYSMGIPTDIASFFEETGTGFDPGLTFPLQTVSIYEGPEEMALLLGVLGVDMSYCSLFERTHEAAECYKYIDLLAGKLDLPSEIVDHTPEQQRSYLKNTDSLNNMISRVYSDMDRHFRENNQSSFASLSLLGGWIEAMYIGVNIYKNKSVVEMGDRILQQKYSLNSLTGLLANHQEILLVRQYMHPLNKLKKVYEEIEIAYDTEGFEMDREAQTFHAAVSEIRYEPETLEEICQIILQLRKEITR